MITLDTDQEPLLRSSAVQVLDLCVLTTYSDRVAETVDTVYYFSGATFLYDYGNTGTDREFEPYLAGIESELEAMNHLPTNVTGLRRTRRITLRNGERGAETLWKTLRGKNLEYARVELSTIALEATDVTGWHDGRSFTGDEHTVMFRGQVQLVRQVSDVIELELESELPQIPWLVASDATKNDPLDLGRRYPIVYGAAKKIPAVGYEVGWVTTTAEENTVGQTTLEVTDASGLPTSGTGRIGTDVFTWTGKTGNQLTGIPSSGGNQLSAHKAGSVVLEKITTATWILAGHEC